MGIGWLKKAGKVALQGIALAAGNAPAIKLITPDNVDRIVDATVGELTQIAGIIVTVEAAGQAWNQPGAEKLRVAGPLVAQAVARSSLLVGKEIGDKAKYDAACATIAGGVADLLNSLKADPDAQG